MREKLPEGILLALSLACFLIGYRFSDPTLTPFSLAPKAEGHLRVMTWNVGGTAGGRGISLLVFNVPDVARTIREADPDILVLQEIGSRERLTDLTEEIKILWNVEVDPGKGVAVLTREGGFQRFSLPDSRAVGATWQSKKFGEISIAGIHAPTFSAQERNREIGQVLNELVIQPGRKVFAGDFNLDLDLDKKRDLFTDDLYRDVETYNYVGKQLMDVGLDGGPTAEPDRRLDYIFVSPGRFQVVRAGPWKGKRQATMDHDPVVADLKILR